MNGGGLETEIFTWENDFEENSFQINTNARVIMVYKRDRLTLHMIKTHKLRSFSQVHTVL